MAEAVSTQLAVPPSPASMQLDSPGSGNQTADASRTELVKEKNLYVTDARGNSKLVRMVERWELMTVHDRLFVKPLGRRIFERVASQLPPTMGTFPAAFSLPIVVSQPAFIRNATYPMLSAACRALPDRSVASLFPMAHGMHAFVTRPELSDSPSARMVIEVLSKVAQLVAYLSGGSVQLIDARQGKSEGHTTTLAGGSYLSRAESICELLSHLINSLRLQGRPEDIQKAMDFIQIRGEVVTGFKKTLTH